MNYKCKYDQVKLELAHRYNEELKRVDLEDIYSDDYHSGIFLAAPHESYFSGGMKVFIIGQETRGWMSNECEAKQRQPITLNGIRTSMESTLHFNLKSPGTSKFRQFYKVASKRLCINSFNPSNAALWSNQFCVSYKGKNALKSPKFNAIQNLSFQLLRAQFEILKPDIAIFTTGHGRDDYLKQCFTTYETVQIHKPKRLWEFMVGDVRCFRTNHPTWGGSNQFLREAVKYAATI